MRWMLERFAPVPSSFKFEDVRYVPSITKYLSTVPVAKAATDTLRRQSTWERAVVQLVEVRIEFAAFETSSLVLSQDE